MDALGRDDEDGVFFHVVERVDFVAFIDAEGPAAEEEEGDVGAERGGDFDEAFEGDALAGELEVAEESCCGVAGAATESAAGGDFFVEVDFDAGADFEFAAEGFDGAEDEIFFDGLLGEACVAVDCERDF